MFCLTLSKTTNSRLFQTETVCRRQFLISCKYQKVLQTGRKHCGKRSNCSLRAISPFPTVFKKKVYYVHEKIKKKGGGLVWEEVNCQDISFMQLKTVREKGCWFTCKNISPSKNYFKMLFFLAIKK